MSLDWELASTDVEEVLKQHGVPASEGLVEWVFEDKERILQRAKQFSHMSLQIDAAYSEIEDILFENKIIDGRKMFRCPALEAHEA